MPALFVFRKPLMCGLVSWRNLSHEARILGSGRTRPAAEAQRGVSLWQQVYLRAAAADRSALTDHRGFAIGEADETIQKRSHPRFPAQLVSVITSL